MVFSLHCNYELISQGYKVSSGIADKFEQAANEQVSLRPSTLRYVASSASQLARPRLSTSMKAIGRTHIITLHLGVGCCTNSAPEILLLSGSGHGLFSTVDRSVSGTIEQ